MKKHRRLNSVRVLGKDFKLRYETEGNLELQDYGHMKYTKLEIAIRDGMPKQLEQDTLMHELIHAIEVQTDLNLSEAQVRTLGCGIVQVLADNPELAKFLIS